MALRYAVASGDWSNTATWDGGTLPTADDDVRSNTFTVTVDGDYTVLSVSNRNESPAVAGGTFNLSDGVTLTCTANPGVIGGAVNTGAVQILINASATLVANVFGGSISSSNGVRLTTTGTTLAIVGDVSGGSNANSIGVQCSSVGSISITGSVTGGSASGCFGVQITSVGTVSITGSVTGGSSAIGALNNNAAGILSITGAVTGGSAAGSFGAQNNSTGTLNVAGLITASNFANGIGAGNSAQLTRLTGPFVSHPSGMSGNAAARWTWAETLTPTYLSAPTVDGLDARLLYSENAANSPAPANVRTGIVYGATLELTGTCAVPAASTVLVGVAVDNTVGTAPLTAQSIRDAVGLATANLDTQLGAIPTNPLLTTDARLNTLDAAISTRLAALSYSDPLTILETASAVDDALTAYGVATLASIDPLVALAQADEVISPTQYRKLAAGTETAILTKAVTNDGAGNIELRAAP